MLASILGNKVNYLIGRAIGHAYFTAKQSWLFNKKHLEEAHTFMKNMAAKPLFSPVLSLSSAHSHRLLLALAT